MALFKHPLQLFTLEHPDEWEVRYQEETGGVIFIHSREEATALSVSAVAVTGAELPLVEQVVEAGARLGIPLAPEQVRIHGSSDTRTGYAEGTRPDGDLAGSLYRFWVIRHGPLMLYVAQL